MEIDGYVNWNAVAGKNFHNERIDINIFEWKMYHIVSKEQFIHVYLF